MGFIRVKALFQITLLVISVLYISLIFAPPVVAQNDEQKVCCEKTTSGEYCSYTGESQCDPSFNSAPTTCDQTSFCQSVCCIDTFEGDCFKNVPTSLCSNTANMTLDARDPTCRSNPACQSGCCQIGNQCFLGTQRECTFNPGVPSSFDPKITSELECVNQCRQVEEGCCVDPQSGCSYTSRSACSVAEQTDLRTGTVGFFTDTFCSAPGLACHCTTHFKKGCAPGEDEVYWFDSCGNREDVAEDCDYGQGTICRETEGVASCESVNCGDTADFPSNVHDPEMGEFRKNGESWCVYENGVGSYLDRPGSRHYRHLCINGHELVEPCRDFRQEVCIQATVTITTQHQRDTFTESNCLRNEIYDSILTEEQTLVPKGQRFWDGENEQICREGSFDCIVYFVKKDSFSDWECKGNCQCLDQNFIDQAAYYCKSKGDCGADLTIFDKRSEDGLKVTWGGTSMGDEPTRVSEHQWREWSKFGVFAGMKQISEKMSTEVAYEPNDVTKDLINNYGSVLLATYVVASVAAAASTTSTLAQTLVLSFWSENAGNIVNGINFVFSSSSGAAAGTGGATGGTGAAGGSGAGTSAGAGSSNAAGVASVIGVVIGVVLLVYGIATGNYVTAVQGLALAVGCAFGPLGCVVGAIVGVILSLVLGKAKVREKHVQISCLPWQAPRGGADCERCDDDPFKECSEYRCRSLGAACILVNEGTTEVACISTNPNDVSSPHITPSRESLSRGFTFSETPGGFKINEHVPPFTRLSFGVNLDEPAQCRFDTAHTGSYEEMTSLFGTSMYRETQNMTLSLLTPGDYAYYLRCTDAIGNANVQEYSVQFSVSDEPDRTAPVIEGTSIDNNAAMPHGVNETALVLLLNEPAAQCRWSTVDADFDHMPEENLFVCGNDADFDGTPAAFLPPLSDRAPACAGLLKGIDDGQLNQYFIRCKDLSGNTNQESFAFSLRGTTDLQITGSGPTGTLYTKDVRLSVLTSGGANQGAATCSYNNIDFLKTGQALHEQPLLELLPGQYSFPITCRDIAGNEATTTISFGIDVDTYAPALISVYVQDNLLHVITDEPSNCRYSTTDDTFIFDQGTAMNGDGTTEHTLSEVAPLYYLQCRDSFENELVATLYV